MRDATFPIIVTIERIGISSMSLRTTTFRAALRGFTGQVACVCVWNVYLHALSLKLYRAVLTIVKFVCRSTRRFLYIFCLEYFNGTSGLHRTRKRRLENLMRRKLPFFNIRHGTCIVRQIVVRLFARIHLNKVLFYRRQMCLAEVSFSASTMDHVCSTKWRKCENDNCVSTRWENQQRNDEEWPYFSLTSESFSIVSTSYLRVVHACTKQGENFMVLK